MVNNTNFTLLSKNFTDKLGNLEVGKTYASGFMNLGNLTVHSIKQIKGVYTNYLGHYFSKALLDSQLVSFQETSDSEYYFSSRTSITSSVSFGAEFAATIGGQVGFGELSGSLDMKATLGYKLSSESYYSYGYNFYFVASSVNI